MNSSFFVKNSIFDYNLINKINFNYLIKNMAKLPLNQVANTIREEDKKKWFIPEDKVERAQYIKDIKNAFGYTKDEDNKKTKRERREKIRELAKDNPEKIQQLKDVLYTKEEKQGSIEAKENLPETAQSKNRDSMLSYAQKNDTEHAERIEGRLWTINELRAKWIINDSSEWVNVKGLWKFASTKTYNKVLEENFWKKVNEPFDWENHAWNKSKLNTVRKDDLDKKMKKWLVWNYKLGSKKFIENTIFPWIEQNFEWVKNQDDKLYILQLINPDLFTRLWLDSVDSTWHSRQRVKLGRSIHNRNFDDDDIANDRWGLFLVWNA